MFVSFYDLFSWGVIAACPFALQGLSPFLVSVHFWRLLVPSQAWGPSEGWHWGRRYSTACMGVRVTCYWAGT